MVRAAALLAVPALLALGGCGGVLSGDPGNGSFSISPAVATVDTNCTGCNTTNSSGAPVEQFSTGLTGAGAAGVSWTVSGGDANSGAGTITASGQYTPPSYLTADSAQVTVTAALKSSLASGPATTASTVLTVTPGFLQPLTPENAALGANGQLTITGYIAEAGGTDGIDFAVSGTAEGSSGGQGTVIASLCVRSASAFTYCTATYTAPEAISSTGATYVVATVGNSSSKTATEVLLDREGVTSNAETHQTEQVATPILLGSSGSNDNDYDTQGNRIVDCCGGTLGSLIENASGTEYLLSNNHVLAESDQAHMNDTIIQPGLIDDDCKPYADGGSVTPVGTLSAWLPLSSSSTNADAAIAQVNSGAVNTSGSILELGPRQPDGTLAAAPPGVSSTGGKGENAEINMTVAKSGRTTGLTCANVAALDLDVQVEYYRDCAETKPYLTKDYTNQIGIEGNQFSDAGDSGSLVVDASDAEPVGLFFAGGVDSSGVSEGVANPASGVLSELDAQVGGGPFTFVGTTDHAVSCLNYGNSAATAAQGRALAGAETQRTEQAVMQARTLVNPAAGILGVAMGKSSDNIGEGAVIVYVDQSMKVQVPAAVGGVRTLVIPATARAVAMGTAPQTAFAAGAAPALPAAALNRAVARKQQIAQSLMQQNPAFFGVGVGQSYDDPTQAALVIYVDREEVPAQLPATIDGLRTRYVVMSRLHVTRAYARGLQSRSRCMIGPAAPKKANDPFKLNKPMRLKAF